MTAPQDAAKAIAPPKDIVRVYAQEKPPRPPSRLKLWYDMAMVVAIAIDLAVIFFDSVVSGAFFAHVAPHLGLGAWQESYSQNGHRLVAIAGGFFTLFLVAELLVRWGVAIKKQTYYRWFFFPFAHWYEVLGCFPLLRPLRLLRAVAIVKRLHAMNVKVVPERWIKSAQFYGHILLEELSDRVILTAIGNFRNQLKSSTTHQALIEETLDKNRVHIETALLELLRDELRPKLGDLARSKALEDLSLRIGEAAAQVLSDSPELGRYLKRIPIAGSFIEAQLADIGRSIGAQVASAVHKALLDTQTLDALMASVASGVANVDINKPELKRLVGNMLSDGLDAFEIQVKTQQYAHAEHLRAL